MKNNKKNKILIEPMKPIKSAAKSASKKKKKKFYAVRKGVAPGIYSKYAECLEQVRGFSRAEYKGFATMEEAQKYIDQGKKHDVVRETVPADALHVYTDGSLEPRTNRKGAGMYAKLPDGKEIRMYAEMTYDFADEADPQINFDMDRGKIKSSSSMAELFAVFLSIKRLTAAGYKKLVIHADNDGVRNWYTGAWETRQPAIRYLTGAIKLFARDCEYFSIAAVDGHSGDLGNDEADRLAGIASSGDGDRSLYGVLQFSEKCMEMI